MSKKEKRLFGITIALYTLIVILIGYGIIQDAKDYQEFKKQLKIDRQVDIHQINDSTYHINLGNGSSCFTVEHSNDSLYFTSVNVANIIIENDSIFILSKPSSWKHTYNFAYNDFFNDTIPYKSKIKFNFN